MKKINFLLLMITVFLFSCKKNNEQTETVAEFSKNPAINQLLSNRNSSEQKNMFRLLSSDEKAEAWKIKFSNFLRNPNLNEAQINFVNKVNSLITIELFAGDNLKINEPEIKARAIELFGVSGAFNLLASIQLIDENSDSSLVSGSGGSCGCSGDSDWCGSSSACYTIGCTSSSSGCGTLWLYSCNGNCVRYHVY